MKRIRSADDWWDRLASDPEFEREMIERQRRLGVIYGDRLAEIHSLTSESCTHAFPGALAAAI